MDSTLDRAVPNRALRDDRFRAALAHRPPPAGWRTRGSCTREDPELFFPHPTTDPTAALEVCAQCPVLGPCLATALELGDTEGVWGATTAAERRWMRPAWQRTLH
ncbi:MAG: WhiB family transcriptional regulator [Mycobacteriales bacterium]